MTRNRNRNLNVCQRGLLPAIVVLTPLALVENTEAACAPVSPLNNTIVTCTGFTSNQNDPNGFGTAADTGNTINVRGGAVVTGTQFGIKAATTTVNNSGTIEAVGAGGIAINAVTANVDNAGTIQAPGGFGIVANNATVTNAGLGVIAGGETAISATTAFVDNVGRIQSAGTTRAAIDVLTAATVINSGTILATGPGSIGISAGTANVSNSGAIFGESEAIFAHTAANVFNTRTISAKTGITALGAGGVGSNITSSGTIAGTAGKAILLSPAADTS